jgi:hypothetical protein
VLFSGCSLNMSYQHIGNISFGVQAEGDVAYSFQYFPPSFFITCGMLNGRRMQPLFYGEHCRN